MISDNGHISCDEAQFTCRDGSCVNSTLTCDNITHCPDGSDEDVDYARCKYSFCVK